MEENNIVIKNKLIYYLKMLNIQDGQKNKGKQEMKIINLII